VIPEGLKSSAAIIKGRAVRAGVCNTGHRHKAESRWLAKCSKKSFQNTGMSPGQKNLTLGPDR